MSIMLQVLSRLPKDKFYLLTSKMVSHTKRSFHESLHDSDSCQGCPVFKQKAELLDAFEKARGISDETEVSEILAKIASIDKVCSEAKCAGVQTKSVYYNSIYPKYEKHHGSYDMKRLPKACIKVYLLVASCVKDGALHIVKNISIESIASELGLSLPTVTNALNVLDDYNFISMSNAYDKKSKNIMITGYDTMHQKAADGGVGYITLSSDIIHNLLKISNVNELRFSLYAYLNADNQRVSKFHEDNYVAALHDIKLKLPHNASYKKELTRILTSSEFFTFVSDGTKFLYTTKGLFSLDHVKKIAENTAEKIKSYIRENNYDLTQEDIADICSITTQYSFENICHAICNMYTYSKFNKVNSPGAFIRSFCYSKVLKSYQCA